jgi:hypothetical protein
LDPDRVFMRGGKKKEREREKKKLVEEELATASMAE